jgi:hypothetical protein
MRPSEVNKVFECSFQRLMLCADDSPLVRFRGFGDFFHAPLHVGQEKSNRLADAGNLVVVEKDHAAGAKRLLR